MRLNTTISEVGLNLDRSILSHDQVFPLLWGCITNIQKMHAVTMHSFEEHCDNITLVLFASVIHSAVFNFFSQFPWAPITITNIYTLLFSKSVDKVVCIGKSIHGSLPPKRAHNLYLQKNYLQKICSCRKITQQPATGKKDAMLR